MPQLRPFLLTATLVALSLSLAAPGAVDASVPRVTRTSPTAMPSRTPQPHLLPTRVRFRRPTVTPTSPAPAMKYHGGPVMPGPVNVYVVWYGNWTRKTKRRAIITDFIANFAGPRFAINTTYPNRAGLTVTNAVSLAGEFVDRYSLGRRRITDDKVGDVVAGAIKAGKLPSDPSGIYLVLTSNDVGKPGFLSQYCGWHTFRRIGTVSIKYAFVGDPTGPNLLVCGAQKVSPNGDAGADAMVSVIAHEIDEAVTDPELTAWYDDAGEENADRCAWSYGRTFTVGRAKANVRLGARNYLLQRNWLNAQRGRCVLAAPNA